MIFKLQQWVCPKYFYYKSRPLIPWLLGLAVICLSVGLFMGLLVVPADYLQQDGFRIIYVHVPAAFMSLSIYAIIGMLSFGYLIWRIKLMDVLANVSAPIGASCTVLALVTGAVWGKPMWGTWWVWDARLTSELILLFLYIGYIALRSAISDPKAAAKACALIGVVGLLDLPVIHYSVEWWQTLHQGATLAKLSKPGMAAEMLYPLLLAIVGFYAFYIASMLLFARSQTLWQERRQVWVQNIIKDGA